MSATRPYVILDEDDCSEPITIDIGDSDSDSDSDSKPEVVSEGYRPSHASIELPEILIESCKLRTDEIIRPGETVELLNITPGYQTMQSGDFLRVKHIIKNLETDNVRLRGYRMRRLKYFGPLFDWTLNELAMVLCINEGDDDRSLLIAGLEDINVDEVFRMRHCLFTDKPRPPPGCGSPIVVNVSRNMTQREIKEHLFNSGMLTCRCIYVQHMNTRTQKSYSGIVRHLYAREVSELGSSEDDVPPRLLRNRIAIQVDHDDDCVIVTKQSTQKRHRENTASSGIEILKEPPTRRIKKGRLTFGDGFCGSGGASQGAVQAGYLVRWGLDKNEQAIEAYSLNHPGAFPFLMDAHDFPPEYLGRDFLVVDVLHLSPPCCYFSPAHTTDGPNDQANYDAIFTIEEILKRVKPRVLTLEQTSGLITHHKEIFFKLLNDIGRAGYNVRYKRQDLSELGLAQKRKRLLIIAARRGTPLPPFPKIIHGSPRTNVKSFTTIADALRPLAHTGSRAYDLYHQPRFFGSPKTPYSPDSQLQGCITTGGTRSYHPSGDRNFTVRELSLLQGFPETYHFTGTKTEASKQVGNAFPPVAAEAVYRTIAKTLRAFDEGLIGAEDDLNGLQDHDEIIELSDDE